MALNGLFCADVPLRNYSLTHSSVNRGLSTALSMRCQSAVVSKFFLIIISWIFD